MRQVLSVASECVPLLKTGGLADVVGALPKALAAQGWHMRVLMPAYQGLLKKFGLSTPVWSDPDLFGGPARVVAGQVAGMDMLLLDAPHLYERPGGPYSDPVGDYADNAERFAALSWAAAEIARTGLTDGWRPEVVHCHDWQSGFTPAYMRFAGTDDVRTVITVHNIAFQGWAPADKLVDLRLPPAAFTADQLEYYGGLSSLKAALVMADAITTVSPTYASELMRSEFGLGLEGVIAARANDVHGILNGVDTDMWSPETDPAIHPYQARSLAGKTKNRKAIIKEFKLGPVPGPLAVIVSRMTTQKGLDLVPDLLSEFIWRGGGLIVLGSGDPQIEMALLHQAQLNPRRVAVRIGFDEDLSHRLFAGADAVLVPSRFEPCGLTQMYGLRYGTVPLVAATGGLNDTVVDANPAALEAGVATGVVFHPTDALALAQALRRLVTLYEDTRSWRQIQRNGMKADLDWTRSSAAYAALYEGLAE